MNVHVSNEVMHHPYSRWTKPFLTKVVVLGVILLISLQYFVNVAVFRRNESVVFLNLLDSSVNNMLNQTGLVVQESMRETVTTIEKPKEFCPVIPPKLKGHVKVNVQVAAWAYIEEENALLSPGGRYRPPDCQARHRVAIIIPYRDREIHLKIFLRNIHPFLQRQQLDYGIFVVEMAHDVKFNRALLLNVGFVEALKQHDYQCFVFHDVDLLPEDDRNLYTCPQTPRHMSVAIDRLQYKLPYSQIFGGVSAIAKDHFKRINGFSNIFFGWGGEDDDMYRRILYSNLTVIRYSPEVARYKMLIHAKEHGNSDRFMLLRTVKARRLTDGLSSLKYKVEKLELRPLYTWILVSVNETEIVNAEPIHKLALKNLKLRKAQKKPNAVSNNKPITNGKGMNIRDKENNKVNAVNTRKANGVVQPNDVDQNGHRNKSEGVKGEQVNSGLKQKAVNIPKIQSAAPKQSVKIKQKKPVLKIKNPTMVSWIPTDFKGIIPTNLTKFDALPIAVPAHMQSRKGLLGSKQRELTNKQQRLRQSFAESKNVIKQMLTNKQPQLANIYSARRPALIGPQTLHNNVKVDENGNPKLPQNVILLKDGNGNTNVELLANEMQSVHDILSLHDYIPKDMEVNFSKNINDSITVR